MCQIFLSIPETCQAINLHKYINSSILLCEDSFSMGRLIVLDHEYQRLRTGIDLFKEIHSNETQIKIL